MKKFLLSALTVFILMSCFTTGQCAQQAHKFKANEIDAIIGQWDYKLMTEDGIKIIGFFQVAPLNDETLSVVGQAYFDKGNKTLISKNMRGVWTGSMRKAKLQHYVLAFAMRRNPLSTSTKKAEPPYHGTIYFHNNKNNGVLDGRFSDHDSREGISGTITAYKHQ